MKRKIRVIIIGLLVAVLLIGGLLTSHAVANDKIVLKDNGQMLVIYVKDTQEYVTSIRGPATFFIRYNNLYMIVGQWWNQRVTNLNVTDYLICPYQKITPAEEYDEDAGEFVTVSLYIYNMGLTSYDTENLPHSQHIAKLVGVNPDAKKPATVARKYLGNIYYENCLVSMPAKEAYQAGTLAVGDYVVITYIDEIPDDNEINVCVLEYGIWESW